MSGAGGAGERAAGSEGARDPERTLARANARLAALCGREPVALERGGAAALEDRLWVWGVLGGKEVGKSTLVQALTGARPDPAGDPLREGTRHPVVYCAAADREALERRFAGLPELALEFARAPEGLRGLALVDLPDFDSLFEDHAEQVRRIATRLDGVLWVATPKKVGDRRGLAEVRRLLKDRANIAHVVNKLDWLLAQADGPPGKELERVAAALAAQMGGSELAGVRAGAPAGDGPGAGGGRPAEPGGRRAFLISALHPTEGGLLAAIAAQQGLADARPLRADPECAAAVARVAGDFARLRALLTTAPSAEAALAAKRANLGFQLRSQAQALLAAYRPGRIAARLERATAEPELEELLLRFLPPAWAEAVLRRLQPRERLLSEWSQALFASRLAGWPLLGLVAWPALLLAGALGAAGAWLRREGPQAAEASFDAQGVPLAERLAGLRAAFANRLAGQPALSIELPAEAALARDFRARALALVEEQRAAVLEPLLRERPGVLRRAARGALALAILLWFPLVQPVLAGLLGALRGGAAEGPDAALAAAAAVAAALSGRAVLAGLAASLLLLGLLAAGVHARAVGRALGLLERLEGELLARGARELVGQSARALAAPAHEAQRELASLAGDLERLAERGAADPSGGA
jgi:hypothetical protein